MSLPAYDNLDAKLAEAKILAERIGMEGSPEGDAYAAAAASNAMLEVLLLANETLFQDHHGLSGKSARILGVIFELAALMRARSGVVAGSPLDSALVDIQALVTALQEVSTSGQTAIGEDRSAAIAAIAAARQAAIDAISGLTTDVDLTGLAVTVTVVDDVPSFQLSNNGLVISTTPIPDLTVEGGGATLSAEDDTSLTLNTADGNRTLLKDAARGETVPNYDPSTRRALDQDGNPLEVPALNPQNNTLEDLDGNVIPIPQIDATTGALEDPQGNPVNVVRFDPNNGDLLDPDGYPLRVAEFNVDGDLLDLNGSPLAIPGLDVNSGKVLDLDGNPLPIARFDPQTGEVIDLNGVPISITSAPPRVYHGADPSVTRTTGAVSQERVGWTEVADFRDRPEGETVAFDVYSMLEPPKPGPPLDLGAPWRFEAVFGEEQITVFVPDIEGVVRFETTHYLVGAGSNGDNLKAHLPGPITDSGEGAVIPNLPAGTYEVAVRSVAQITVGPDRNGETRAVETVSQWASLGSGTVTPEVVPVVNSIGPMDAPTVGYSAGDVTVTRGLAQPQGDGTHWYVFFSADGVTRGPYGDPAVSVPYGVTQQVLDLATEVPATARYIATECGNYTYPIPVDAVTQTGPLSPWVEIPRPIGAYDFADLSLDGEVRRVCAIEAENFDSNLPKVGSAGWQARTAEEGTLFFGVSLHTNASPSSAPSAIHAPDRSAAQAWVPGGGDIVNYRFRTGADELGVPLTIHFRWKRYDNDDRFGWRILDVDGTTELAAGSVGDADRDADPGPPLSFYSEDLLWMWSERDQYGNAFNQFTPPANGVYTLELLTGEQNVSVDKIVFVDAEGVDMTTLDDPYGPPESTRS